MFVPLAKAIDVGATNDTPKAEAVPGWKVVGVDVDPPATTSDPTLATVIPLPIIVPLAVKVPLFAFMVMGLSDDNVVPASNVTLVPVIVTGAPFKLSVPEVTPGAFDNSSVLPPPEPWNDDDNDHPTAELPRLSLTYIVADTVPESPGPPTNTCGV